MKTPIYDFVSRYAESGAARLHMPGHKGQGPLGCEALDITEIHGADVLSAAGGVIAESEKNAASLFGSGATFYSTEGSSACIRAMLYLATAGRGEKRPIILAARNVHKAFVQAAALLDLAVEWLRPEENTSLCQCPVSAEMLESRLRSMAEKPVALYVTSPDYLGGMADIAALSAVCRRYGILLLADNAHGAYLHFLQKPCHPLDLGADLCCDSAHKTLPVLTGGAYLHLSASLPDSFFERAREALSLFSSTSPSYLTLASLDLCNRYLADGYRERLSATVTLLESARQSLGENGWISHPSDPLRLTVRMPVGLSGDAVSARLHENGIECEYADQTMLVAMLTPENHREEVERFIECMGKNPFAYEAEPALPVSNAEQVLSVREALFAPQETVSVADAMGRICGAPTVSCPPAVPIVVSGERIGENEMLLLRCYGMNQIRVVKETNL